MIKPAVIVLALFSLVSSANAIEVDCSSEAMNQRSDALLVLQSEAMRSRDLKTIDGLIEKQETLYAMQRICLRANIHIIDGSNN